MTQHVLRLYLDTNALQAIASDPDKLIAAHKHGRVQVYCSLENLAETLVMLQHRPAQKRDKLNRTVRLLLELGVCNGLLRHSSVLVSSDVGTLVQTGTVLSGQPTLDPPLGGAVIRRLRNVSYLNNDDEQWLVDAFVVPHIRLKTAWMQHASEQKAKICTKLTEWTLATGQRTDGWREFWRNVNERRTPEGAEFADAWARWLLLHHGMNENSITSFLAVAAKTGRMDCVPSLGHLFYLTLRYYHDGASCTGRKPATGDLMDAYHVVYATRADVFVTIEGYLSDRMQHYDHCGFQVWSQKELAASIE